jgi:hypothetical protein
MENCSPPPQKASVQTVSASTIWEGMSGSGARTNTNQVQARECRAAVRGSFTTESSRCRPSATTTPPTIASEPLDFVR